MKGICNMDLQKRRTKKRKFIFKGKLDFYLTEIQSKISKVLRSFGYVISDCILPQEKYTKKELAEKKHYINGIITELFLSFFLGLSPLGGEYPFGISFLCAESNPKYAVFGLAGSLISGAIIRKLSPIRMTSYLLIYLLRRTFSENKLNEKLSVRIFYSLFFSAFLSVCNVFGGKITYSDIFRLTFNCILSCCAVYLFFIFFTAKEKKYSYGIYLASLYAVITCTVPAMKAFSPFGIDASLIYASLLVLFLAKNQGPIYGCIAGFIFGFMCSNPLYCAPLGCGGLICGYVFARSFSVACISFTAASSMCATYLFGFSSLSNFFPFTFSASLIFAFFGKAFTMPSLQTARKKSSKKASVAGKSDSSFEIVSESLSGLSSILYKFAEHLKGPSRAETSDVIDNAFNEICSRCSMNEMCYAKRECSFDKVRETLTERLENGVLKEAYLSEKLLHKCIKSEELCDYINRHFSELRFITMKENRAEGIAGLYSSMSRLIKTTEKEDHAKNMRDTAIESYVAEALEKLGVDFSAVVCTGTRTKDISVYGIRADKIPCSGKDLCSYLSKRCRLTLTEPTFDIAENGDFIMKISRKEIIACEYAQYTEAKRGEDVNGDTVTFFEAKNGLFYGLIADGMGSGKAAAATSRLTCVFLERLLKSGTRKNVCLELLNNLLISKNDETFSGVDLLEIDKLGSTACFIKAGAASSFILRGMKLYKIRSETPPVGIINSFSAESTSFSLEKGDVIIMLSDGIFGSDGDEKQLSDIIRLDTKDEPALLASKIVKKAAEKSGQNDDMSAAVIKII